MSSLRDRLVSTPPAFRRRTVDVPEWGCKLEVRALSVAAKERLGTLADNAQAVLDVQVFLLTSSVFDPDTGEVVFTDADAEWIGQQEASVVETVATAVLELSGLAGEQKEMVAGPKDGSSPTPSTAMSSSEPNA